MELTITKIIQESSKISRFFFKNEDSDTIQFEAGQFIMLKHPNWLDSADSRSYSLANENTDAKELEICVVLNEMGMFTPWLFSLEVGATIQASAPVGSFIFKEDEHDGPEVFICTGTGIAPFRSMITKALNLNREVHLVFGNRYKIDVPYHEYWLELAQKNALFHYYPVFSREEFAQYKGYVHPIYESILQGQSDPRIYVCGWQEMCIEARERLKKMGFNRRQYFFEQYN